MLTINTTCQLLTPKTKGSVRTIKIDEMLINMLQKHQFKQIKIKNGFVYQDNGFILHERMGIKN